MEEKTKHTGFNLVSGVSGPFCISFFNGNKKTGTEERQDVGFCALRNPLLNYFPPNLPSSQRSVLRKGRKVGARVKSQHALVEGVRSGGHGASRSPLCAVEPAGVQAPGQWVPAGGSGGHAARGDPTRLQRAWGADWTRRHPALPPAAPPGPPPGCPPRQQAQPPQTQPERQPGVPGRHGEAGVRVREWSLESGGGVKGCATPPAAWTLPRNGCLQADSGKGMPDARTWGQRCQGVTKQQRSTHTLRRPVLGHLPPQLHPPGLRGQATQSQGAFLSCLLLFLRFRRVTGPWLLPEKSRSQKRGAGGCSRRSGANRLGPSPGHTTVSVKCRTSGCDRAGQHGAGTAAPAAGWVSARGQLPRGQQPAGREPDCRRGKRARHTLRAGPTSPRGPPRPCARPAGFPRPEARGAASTGPL